jgi:CDP-diacylglycerol---glycerol-3-phosphate 3-phosphatidyltransferase
VNPVADHPQSSSRSLTAPSPWNLPNALTLLRIAMVPVFGWSLLVDGGHDDSWRITAFVLFVVAILTDKVDGDLARKRGLVTDFGKIADPIADKALTGMAFVGLSLIGELPWWVTVVVLGRELLITVMRFVVLRHGVIAASRGGKLKTTLQAVALCAFILPFAEIAVFPWLAWALMLAAVVVTLVTGGEYVAQATRMWRDGRAGAARV